MIGILADHFKGALPISYQMELTYKEVIFWFKIYEKQMAKKAVIDEYVNKKKAVPKGIAFINKVKKKIKEWNTVDVEE